jgi:hypothetical protein
VSVLNDPEPERLPDVSHARSDGQAAAMKEFHARAASQPRPPAENEIKAFRGDKPVALDRDRRSLAINSAARPMRAALSRRWSSATTPGDILSVRREAA